MPFSIEPSPEIFSRADFPLLCAARNLQVAVEIGTDIGSYAVEFMSRFRGMWLLCVDPYEPYEEMGYDRIGDLMVAVQALAPYHGRVKFIRARSPDAIRLIPQWLPISFVYIDGSHTYESVWKDIRAWWNKLEPNGILAGHDFVGDPKTDGVKRAVTEFARERDLIVRYTQEGGTPISFYIYKKEPAGMLSISKAK